VNRQNCIADAGNPQRNEDMLGVSEAESGHEEGEPQYPRDHHQQGDGRFGVIARPQMSKKIPVKKPFYSELKIY